MMKYIERYLSVILLIALCVIAITSYNDYGIAWDEHDQRRTGIVSANYIFSDSQDLLQYTDRDYGVAFELPLVIIESFLDLEDYRSIFLMRHLITHLFFLVSAFFCFLLIDLLYKNKVLATIGFLLIVLHPRLYAHSFFNTKDIPFMSMFLICFYLNALAFRKKQIKYFVLLGIGVGLLINLRIMGLLLLCLVPLSLLIDALKDKEYKINAKLGLIFIAATSAALYISWPFLWVDPFGNFIFAFKNMAKFRWESSVLFSGEIIKASEIGWDYIPRWFSITTPTVYLAAGAFGLFMLVFHFLKKPSTYLFNHKERNNLVFLICFIAPVVSVIALRSVLYDGWRQLYFIYPPFVLLAIYGLNILYEKNMKKSVVAVSTITFIFIGFFMVKNHPLQHVFFNKLVDTHSHEHLRKQYELDYWGTSYKESLEYILENDLSPSIDIYAANIPGLINKGILTSEKRKRLNFVKSADEAKYFLTNYRLHPGDYEGLEQFKWHSIKVGNNSLNTIYRLR